MTKYRFIGRDGNRYIWQSVQPVDSRYEQITCRIDWFWRIPAGGRTPPRRQRTQLNKP